MDTCMDTCAGDPARRTREGGREITGSCRRRVSMQSKGVHLSPALSTGEGVGGSRFSWIGRRTRLTLSPL